MAHHQGSRAGLPADHLSTVLAAALDPALVLRVVDGEVTIVGGNDDWARLAEMPTGELVRKPPSICMSERLAAEVGRAIEAGVAGAVALPSAPDQRVGSTEVELRLIGFQPEGGQQFVMLTAHLRHAGAAAPPEAVPAPDAARDALTGLATRDTFISRVGDGVAAGEIEELSIAVIDLDDFETVNDALGDDAGDSVLSTIAERLRGQVSGQSLVARLDGDEFAVAVGAPSGTGNAELCYQISQVFAEPVRVGDHEFQVTASTGVVTSDEPEEMRPRKMIKRAEIAVRESKRRGKNRVSSYDESIERRTSARLELESELRAAIDDQQFTLVYQPILDVISGRPVSAEALVRWRHPTRGTVPPREFIRVAEETGLIVPLGAWVLESALEQVSAWNQRLLTRRSLGASINLSGVQLGDPDLESVIRAALSRTGFDPSRLTLEITESVVMNDAENALRVLENLRDLGIAIAIDDFGTGFSSLAYLKRLPAKALKIDRAFVEGLGTNPEDTALVTGIIGLAGAMGLEIVAEGVETDLQLRELRRLGCEHSQGFYHSAPMTAAEFSAWIDEKYPTQLAGEESATPTVDAASPGRRSGLAARFASQDLTNGAVPVSHERARFFDDHA